MSKRFSCNMKPELLYKHGDSWCNLWIVPLILAFRTVHTVVVCLSERLLRQLQIFRTMRSVFLVQPWAWQARQIVDLFGSATWHYTLSMVVKESLRRPKLLLALLVTTYASVFFLFGRNALTVLRVRGQKRRRSFTILSRWSVQIFCIHDVNRLFPDVFWH